MHLRLAHQLAAERHGAFQATHAFNLDSVYVGRTLGNLVRNNDHDREWETMVFQCSWRRYDVQGGVFPIRNLLRPSLTIIFDYLYLTIKIFLQSLLCSCQSSFLSLFLQPTSCPVPTAVALMGQSFR